MAKRRGERGQPCLTPTLYRNGVRHEPGNDVADPLRDAQFAQCGVDKIVVVCIIGIDTVQIDTA